MFYYLWDVPIFMAMGAVGGVMGAGFCHFNVKVTQFRHKCACCRPTSAGYCAFRCQMLVYGSQVQHKPEK